MKGEKMQVRCPDCGRNAAALSPSRLAGHTDYRNSVRGEFPKCAQKTDPTAAIAAAKRAAAQEALAAFDREHPPTKTNGETEGDVRATATFPRTGEGDDES